MGNGTMVEAFELKSPTVISILMSLSWVPPVFLQYLAQISQFFWNLIPNFFNFH